MYKRLVLLMFLLFSPGLRACAPAGWNEQSLQTLKTADFAVANNKKRNALALALTACLADPNPFMRDGIAYSALALWLRTDQLKSKTVHGLFDRLLPMLRAKDDAGFSAPFAALVLSEVARSDRIKPWMTADRRQQLVQAAAEYLASVKDYRGFDDVEGWRHGIAHGADLAMQLALNPLVERPELDGLVDAVLDQVAPAGTHFYHFGEPERLLRPLLYAASRKLYSVEEMQGWIERLMDPAPLSSWEEGFMSASGLAKRHNTMAFLLNGYFSVSHSENESLRTLQPLLSGALKRMP